MELSGENGSWLRERYGALEEAERCGYALLSLKIKRFRNFNRLYGYASGDRLLEAVHTYLNGALEPWEYAARLYAACFGLLIRYRDTADLQERVIRLIRGVRDEAYPEAAGQIFTGVGVYRLPLEGVDYDKALYCAELCRADSPMYHYWSSYYEVYGESYVDERALLLDLRQCVLPGIERGEFRLYLQPKVDLKTGEVNRAEALVRWYDPVRGLVPPGQFLPGLEENGVIRNLDLYLFGEVCAAIERWRREYGRDIQVSANLSKAYFNDKDFLPEYMEVFNRYQIPPQTIQIELLESIVLDRTDQVREIVAKLRACGFQCALDDFGSGFSSYGVLAHTDLDEVKIDRSLFRDQDNWREKTVIQHVVATAHELGMAVVAEGVEERSYVEYLQGLGCDYIQGFVFFHPMPVEEFERRFVQGRERAEL